MIARPTSLFYMHALQSYLVNKPFLAAGTSDDKSFIHSFILPLTRNTTTVYRNTLKIIYNIPIKLFTRLNVVKARKPI